MSYSRWSNSPWYTFWSTSSGPTRGEQILSLWYSMDYAKDWTYNELKQTDVGDLMLAYPGVPYNEILEAQKYIDAFIADVEGASERELCDSYTEYLLNEVGISPEDLDVDSNIERGYN